MKSVPPVGLCLGPAERVEQDLGSLIRAKGLYGSGSLGAGLEAGERVEHRVDLLHPAFLEARDGCRDLVIAACFVEVDAEAVAVDEFAEQLFALVGTEAGDLVVERLAGFGWSVLVSDREEPFEGLLEEGLVGDSLRIAHAMHHPLLCRGRGLNVSA